MQPTELTPHQKQVLETGLWAGRQQAFAMLAGKCSAAKAAALKEIRDSRAYDSLGLTWEDFCPRYAGMCRATADSIIRRYDDYGANYFRLAEICRISPETYQAVAPALEAETIELEGEKFALIPGNAAKIRAGIRHLRAQVTETAKADNHAALDFDSRVKRLAQDLLDYYQRRNNPGTDNLLVSITQSAATRFRNISKTIETGARPNA